MSYLGKYYDHAMKEWTDPKTRDWAINKPSLLVPLITVYWIFCTQLGPAYMKNRRPYKLKRVIQIYNITQVIFNAILTVLGFFAVLHYNWLCQPLNYSLDPREIFVTWIGWCYCALKLYDLLDTVFFVLRKKFNQVSALHLYHHVIMGCPFVIATNFYATGHAVFPFGLNLVVHVFMYLYYFLASLGPEYQKHLWWKRHITELQLLQFGISFLHALSGWYISCGVPRFITIYFLAQSSFFFYLFGQFYINTYLKTTKAAARDPMGGNEYQEEKAPSVSSGDSATEKSQRNEGVETEGISQKKMS